MKVRKKPVWRKSDQTNAELPIGRTWIDDGGTLTELIVVCGHADAYKRKEKVWVAYPFGCPAYHIYSDGPGSVVKAWDRKVSYEREVARVKSNGQDFL